MSVQVSGDGGEDREPTASEQASALCEASPRYAAWLQDAEFQVRRACTLMTIGAGGDWPRANPRLGHAARRSGDWR